MIPRYINCPEQDKGINHVVTLEIERLLERCKRAGITRAVAQDSMRYINLEAMKAATQPAQTRASTKPRPATCESVARTASRVSDLLQNFRRPAGHFGAFAPTTL